MNKKAQANSISIVIPVFNDENHLKNCLESINNQTVKPDEVIVVDNNCTDNSVKVARSYPLAKVVTETKQGVAHARNAGFNASTSSIIGRIDADTILGADWVSQVLNFFSDEEHQKHALSGGCYFYNMRLPRAYGWGQGQIAFRMNRLLLGHYILFGSNMAITRYQWQDVKKEVCNENDIHEDLDLAIHLHRLGYKITYHDSLRVGVKMRRVRSHRDQLWNNLMLWPQTLRKHHLWTWVFGWLGAVLLYCAWPLGPAMEYIARLLGNDPIKE